MLFKCLGTIKGFRKDKYYIGLLNDEVITLYDDNWNSHMVSGVPLDIALKCAEDRNLKYKDIYTNSFERIRTGNRVLCDVYIPHNHIYNVELINIGSSDFYKRFSILIKKSVLCEYCKNLLEKLYKDIPVTGFVDSIIKDLSVCRHEYKINYIKDLSTKILIYHASKFIKADDIEFGNINFDYIKGNKTLLPGKEMAKEFHYLKTIGTQVEFARLQIGRSPDGEVTKTTRGFEIIKDSYLELYRLNKEDIKLPNRATKRSAGYDIYSPTSFELKPGESINICLGVKAFMQEDECLIILPKSGIGLKYRIILDNTIGLIDSDYYNCPETDGCIHFSCRNNGDKVWKIEKGNKLAQAVFVKYLTVCDDNPVSDCRVGGFGSTGV